MSGPVDDGGAARRGGDAARLESFLDELARELPTSREGDSLVDEVRDHLLCDLEHARGSEPRVAPVLATVLARFGDARAVGTSWRRQLESAALGRASDTLLRLVVVVGALWALVLLAGPSEPWAKPAEPVGIRLAEHVCSIGAVLTLALAGLGRACAYLTSRTLAAERNRPATPHIATMVSTALAAIVGVATGGALLAYFLARFQAAPGSLSPAALVLGSAFSFAAVGLAAPSVDRALRHVRMRPTHPPRR